MKKLTILFFIVLISACSGDNNDVIRQQITKKEDQIRQLHKEIQELESQITDSAEMDNAVLVRLKDIQPEEFNHFIVMAGNVEAVEYAWISPEINGQIKEIHVHEGQRVNKGQLLISLNTDVTESSIAEVKTGLELATKLYEKQKSLWEREIGSEIQYLESKNAMESAKARLNTLEAQLEMAKIRAPFSGIVNDILPKKGELASPGMPVLELVNLDDIAVKADIAEVYLGKVKKGEMVEVNFDVLPNLKLKAPVYRVSSVIDKQNRTFEIEVRLNNRDNQIKPNMIATVRVNDFHSEEARVVPSIIIKQDIKGFYMFKGVNQGDGLKAAKIYVEPGHSYEDETMIDKGIEFGDRIIVEGYNLVSSGTRIRTSSN